METLLLQCLFIRNDLEEAKSNILAKGLWLSIAHIKTAFLAFHNLCEYILATCPIFWDHHRKPLDEDNLNTAGSFASHLPKRPSQLNPSANILAHLL